MKITLLSSIFVICCCLWRVLALPDTIVIGGIFDAKDERQELAFRYAVERVNKDKSILPRSNLRAQIEKLPADDSFHAYKRVCVLLRTGVAAIFGPQSENTANHVQSICDAMEVPHIETRWDYKITRDEYSVNLYPYPPSLSKAYHDILMQLQWKSFVIIYDSNEGLVRLQSLLKEKSWTVSVRQLNEDGNYRPLLKEIKKANETRIVLDVAQERIFHVLKQAAQIDMMTEYHNYFITSLDFNLVDLEDFRYYGWTCITGIQLIDPRTQEIKQEVETWNHGELGYGRVLPPHLQHMTTEAALMYDAVHLFAKALEEFDNSMGLEINQLDCDGDNFWQHGNSLMNYIKIYMSRPQTRANMNDTMGSGQYGMETNFSHNNQMPVSGLTGHIKFDTQGFRSDFQLDILEMDNKKVLKKVGTWTPTGGANYTRSWAEAVDTVEMNLPNKTLIVSTVLTPPYSMLKDSSERLEGNDRFKGFCIDLIDEIAKIVDFNYTFIEVGDRQYGSRNKESGNWTGIIQELLDNKADLGIADLTITYEREEAVDFSLPFMNSGIGIIYKKPQKKAPSLFSFMSPFSVDVWIYIATAYLGVSVLLFILARMVPGEWDPCIKEPEELENSFTFLNCLWFMIGTFLCQGGNIAPKAISTRIVAGLWWFFTLIMISYYTANLTAFLILDRMDSPIEGVDDLARQTKIKYGCKYGGSTYSFFRDSNIPAFQRMWETMSSSYPTVFTGTNDEGIERVQISGGQYAFLMESSSIEYEVERKCDLMQVGGLLDFRSYGIALPPGSPYIAPINSAILKLKENGILHMLKTRWWKQRNGGGRCSTEESKDAASAAELGLENVGGVFVVMVLGFAVAIFAACCEFLWKTKKLATEDGVSFCEELRKELLFIVNCRESKKPVRKKSSPAEAYSMSVCGESSSP